MTETQIRVQEESQLVLPEKMAYSPFLAPDNTLSASPTTTRDSSPSPFPSPTPGLSACPKLDRSFSTASSDISTFSRPSTTSRSSSASAALRQRGYVRPQGVAFAASAGNRDSVLSLGSIAHLQYYFARTGLLDGKGGQLAREDESKKARSEGSANRKPKKYILSDEDGIAGDDDAENAIMDEDSNLDWEETVMLPPTVSTYSHKVQHLPPPPDSETLRQDLKKALTEAEQALREVEAQKRDAVETLKDANEYNFAQESSEDSPKSDASAGWHEIQGVHVLDVVTLAIRAAKIYYTAHEHPSRLYSIKSERRIREELLCVMDVLKRMASRYFAGGMKEDELKTIRDWVRGIEDFINQEQALEDKEAVTRTKWQWLDGSWSERERERLFMCSFLPDEMLPDWSAFEESKTEATPTAFLESLRNGLTLVTLHNAILGKSKRQFGDIKTFHTDTSKPYRCAENLRYWIKAAELRWEIKLKVDVTGVVHRRKEAWPDFDAAILQWSKSVREEITQEWKVGSRRISASIPERPNEAASPQPSELKRIFGRAHPGPLPSQCFYGKSKHEPLFLHALLLKRHASPLKRLPALTLLHKPRLIKVPYTHYAGFEKTLEIGKSREPTGLDAWGLRYIVQLPAGLSLIDSGRPGQRAKRKAHLATYIYLLAGTINCIDCQPNVVSRVIQTIHERYCPEAAGAGDSTVKSSMAQSKPIMQIRQGKSGKQPVEAELPPTISRDDPKAGLTRTLTSPVDAESYFTSIRSSRANSIYSISRMSFSSQFSQLTNLHLPDAASLSTSIAGLPSAAAAANTLNVAADEIRKWLKKAKDVLNGLDAEDDVEWAAAGGREGLCEVDAAIGRFEGLITVYVSAIENLQGREDVATVPSELGGLVEQMEKILQEWEGVRKLLKGVKGQVELAMEWEELWNHVLGDIGLEVENLERLVFEMEEARHTAMLAETKFDAGATIDMQELETIVEEAPATNGNPSNHRFSLPPAFAAMSPTSPVFSMPQEDSRLLALFARMQPLRASLDFLPMTLSSFRTKAMAVLPTACQELDDRRRGLEKKWKELEKDAEGLRRELGEDRWVLVFRNAGRQAQKLCESVERSISKLQESIDVGTQHSNPPVLAKKVESYEAKKIHYGPAIERVLAIIDKGVKDRLTVNGEILRLQQDTRARWKAIESEIKDMDVALDDLTMNRNQQLRDSISTIVSMDRSATNSVVDTPGSSPASSPVLGPTGSSKGDPLHSGMNGSSRRSSIISNTTSRPSSSRRHGSITHASPAASHLPLKNPISRSLSDSRNASPSPYSRTTSTPIPGSRAARPSLTTNDYKPRWNSSARVDHLDFTRNSKPSPLPTPPSHRRTSMTFRPPPLSAPPRPTNPPLPSPLSRSSAPSPAPPLTLPRARHASGTHTSLGMRQPSFSSPASHDSRSKARPTAASTPQLSSAGRRQRSVSERVPEEQEEGSPSPSVRPRPQRPLTAMAGRRNSMLPLPRAVIESGRESSMGMRVGGQ